MDCSHLPEAVRHVSVVFTNDLEIHELNLSYRKKDKATDVLSFSQLEGMQIATPLLGDIVISVETAKRQHMKYKTTFPEEVLRLLIHGLLHLFGFDHENVGRAEAAKMRKLEQEQFEQSRHYAPQLLAVR